MAVRFGSEASSCAGKRRLSKRRALEVARHFRRRGENVTEYACKYCGHWHVGHNAQVRV